MRQKETEAERVRQREKERERERLIQQQAKRGKDLVFALLTIIDHCAAFLFS